MQEIYNHCNGGAAQVIEDIFGKLNYDMNNDGIITLLDKFKELPHLNEKQEVITDYEGYAPTLYPYEGKWFVSWVSSEGDSILDFQAESPEKAIELAYNHLFGSKCLPDKEEKMTEERYQYLNSLSLEDYDNETLADEQRQFCEYQHKHHPDEVICFQTHSDEKPKPSEPKFKIGDELVWDKRIVVKVDEVFADGKYLVFSRTGNRYMVKESDLEPYTEPTDLDKESSTCTNDCPSQCPSQNFDNIVNRGFRDHNRLHIAAQIVAALYANYQAAKNFKSIEELVRKALDITDTLIKESEKGGSK